MILRSNSKTPGTFFGMPSLSNWFEEIIDEQTGTCDLFEFKPRVPLALGGDLRRKINESLVFQDPDLATNTNTQHGISCMPNVFLDELGPCDAYVDNCPVVFHDNKRGLVRI